MDDLDRLHDLLATNVRGGFPHLLDRAFQLGDVAEHLVPYRLNRRELGFDSVRQYELALMRLAAGERGYLRVESAVQDAFRRALAAPEPDAALLRDHSRASVALAHDGAPRADAVPPEFAPAPTPTPPAMPAVASPNTPVPFPAPAPPAPAAPPASVPDPIELPPTFGSETPIWGLETPITVPAGLESPPAPMFPTPMPDRWGAAPAAPVDPAPAPTEIGGPCRYCGHTLPEGRPVTFCPNCGQNVTVRLCPACSTELEIGWRFCITCGRAMDESALAAPPPPR